MEAKEIEIVIDEEGRTTFHVKGKKCLDITRSFENAVGIVVDRTNTSDYYKPEDYEQTVQQNQNLRNT